jgi:hypothetical protein
MILLAMILAIEHSTAVQTICLEEILMLILSIAFAYDASYLIE